MRCRLFGFVGLCIFLRLAVPVAAQETVENPSYKMWAAWKEGSFATLKGENHFGEVVSIITSTQTLKKVSADKVVIEVTTINETNGQKITSPPTTMEFLAREPKLSDEIRKMIEAETKRLAAKSTKGKETLTIKGKTLACEWSRYEDQGNVTKAWTCEQVPNLTVKLEMANGPLKSNMQLIDWKGEKK